jgi:RNA polymerase sigma-70 factor (ECF subfamily)
MTQSSRSPDLAQLLCHAAWLRRLALHLAQGHDGADDALQDTWLAALRARPSTDEDVRPWLARVLRNAFARQGRTATRRRRREEAATAFDPVDEEPGAAALERVELQRKLATLVTELEEPYRTTVVMRYFEGHSAAAIARALAVPEGTVRWRTKEGLDRLRARLDQAHGGDRKAWAVVLLPFGTQGQARLRAPLLLAGGLGGLAGLAALVMVLVGARGGQGTASVSPEGAPRIDPPAPSRLWGWMVGTQDV